MNFLDDLWERSIKPRAPQLQAADATDDQTHTHHALVTILLFGTIIALIVWLTRLGSLEYGLRWGFVGGLVFYFVRELLTRFRYGFRFKPWDGALDVLEPVCWTLPVLLDSARLLWVLSLVYAFVYFWLRPVPR